VAPNYKEGAPLFGAPLKRRCATVKWCAKIKKGRYCSEYRMNLRIQQHTIPKVLETVVVYRGVAVSNTRFRLISDFPILIKAGFSLASLILERL
jgi:hypothetical protein